MSKEKKKKPYGYKWKKVFNDPEFYYSMDHSMSLFLAETFKHFGKIKSGHPAYIPEKTWYKMLKRAEKDFRYYHKHSHDIGKLGHDDFDKAMDAHWRLERGMMFFKDYFSHLWY